MASVRPITVTIKGDYTDKDIKRAITDLKSLEKQAPKTSQATSKMGHEMAAVGQSYKAAFAGIGAGVVAALGAKEVLGFFQDTVAIAIEDDKALRSLAVTYANVGLSIPTKETDEWLSSLSRATGIAKGEMVPALQKLITSTGDYEKSQNALKTAMDVAQGSGGTKGLMDVTVALSKAYAGNFTAITRLNSGIDANVIATHDMDKIMAALSARYRGQAAAAADSYAGRLARISVAAELAKEKVGYVLIQGIDDLTARFGGTEGATALVDNFGNILAKDAQHAVDFADALGQIGDEIAKVEGHDTPKILQWLSDHTPDWSWLGAGSSGLAQTVDLFNGYSDALDNVRQSQRAQYDGYVRMGPPLDKATQGIKDNADALDAQANSATKAMSAVDKLKISLDILNGKRQSLREGAVTLGGDRRSLDTFGETTVKGSAVKIKHIRKGKVSWSVAKDAHGNTIMTPDHIKKTLPTLNAAGGLALGSETGGEASTMAQQYATDTLAQVSNLVNAGRADDAKKLLTENRKYLTSIAAEWKVKNPGAFARAYLPTPPVLSRIISDQRAAGITPSNYQNLPGSTTNVFQFSGDLVVKDVADAADQAKKVARLRALSLHRNAGKISRGAA